METTAKERSSVLSRYFSEIREYPLLTKDEEMALAEGVKRGDRSALNELIESNLSLSWPASARDSSRSFWTIALSRLTSCSRLP